MNSVVLTRMGLNGFEKERIDVGSNCFIGHCGSGYSVFGENGKVTKISSKYIYCTSESGSIVKYNIDKNDVCGKWKSKFYFVQFNHTRTYCTPDNKTNTIKSRPSVWNDKKCNLEYK